MRSADSIAGAGTQNDLDNVWILLKFMDGLCHVEILI